MQHSLHALTRFALIWQGDIAGSRRHKTHQQPVNESARHGIADGRSHEFKSGQVHWLAVRPWKRACSLSSGKRPREPIQCPLAAPLVKTGMRADGTARDSRHLAEWPMLTSQSSCGSSLHRAWPAVVSFSSARSTEATCDCSSGLRAGLSDGSRGRSNWHARKHGNSRKVPIDLPGASASRHRSHNLRLACGMQPWVCDA